MLYLFEENARKIAYALVEDLEKARSHKYYLDPLGRGDSVKQDVKLIRDTMFDLEQGIRRIASTGVFQKDFPGKKKMLEAVQKLAGGTRGFPNLEEIMGEEVSKLVIGAAESVNVCFFDGVTRKQQQQVEKELGFDKDQEFEAFSKTGDMKEEDIDRMAFTTAVAANPKLFSPFPLTEREKEDLAALPQEVQDRLDQLSETLSQINQDRDRMDHIRDQGKFPNFNMDTFHQMEEGFKYYTELKNDPKYSAIMKLVSLSGAGKKLDDAEKMMRDFFVKEVESYRKEYSSLPPLSEIREKMRNAAAFMNNDNLRVESETWLTEKLREIDQTVDHLGIHGDNRERYGLLGTRTLGILLNVGPGKDAATKGYVDAYTEARRMIKRINRLQTERSRDLDRISESLDKRGAKNEFYIQDRIDRREQEKRERDEINQRAAQEREERWQNASLKERHEIDPIREAAEWAAYSPAEKLSLDQKRAYDSFKSDKVSYADLENSLSPEDLDAYWGSLGWKEKCALSEERSTSEWMNFTEEERKAADPEREQREWEAFTNKEKAEYSEERAFAYFKEQKLPWDKIREIGEDRSERYYGGLSWEEKKDLLPDRAAQDWGALSWEERFNFDPDKAGPEWYNLPFKEKLKQDPERAEAFWEKRKDKGYYTVEHWKMDPERAQKEFEEKLVPELKDPKDFECLFAPGVRYQMGKRQDLFEYFERYWNKLTLKEKIDSHWAKDERESCRNLALSFIENEVLEAGLSMDEIRAQGSDKFADRFFMDLPLETKKSDFFKPEYDRKWTESDYEGKKALDPERAASYFEELSYEEKKAASQKEARDWFLNQPEADRRFLDFEAALDLKVGPEPRQMDAGAVSEGVQKVLEESQAFGSGKVGKFVNTMEGVIARLLHGEGSINDMENFISASVNIRRDYETNSEEVTLAADEMESFQGKYIKNSRDGGPYTADDKFQIGAEEMGALRIGDNNKLKLTPEQMEDMAKIWKLWKEAGPEGKALADKAICVLDNLNGALEKGSGQNTRRVQELLSSHPEFKYVDERKANDALIEWQDRKEALRIEEGQNLFSDLKGLSKEVQALKDQWKAMESHTLFGFMNSSAFSAMESKYQAFTKTYDNLIAGKTADGKSRREEPERLSGKDIEKLMELQRQMKEAAAAYTSAKREQKGGGIDKHSTSQGQDRLAMADILKNFDFTPKGMEKAASKEISVKRGDAVEKIKLSDLTGTTRAKETLRDRKESLRARETAMQNQNQNQQRPRRSSVSMG